MKKFLRMTLLAAALTLGALVAEELVKNGLSGHPDEPPTY